MIAGSGRIGGGMSIRNIFLSEGPGMTSGFTGATGDAGWLIGGLDHFILILRRGGWGKKVRG